MNKQIKWVGIMLVMCYLAVFARLHQTQLFATQEIAEKPTNQRETERKLNRPRGMIISADNAILARSEDVGGNMTPRKREYPEGDLFAHVTGIYSRLFGTQFGVEKSYDTQLTGDTLRQQFDGLTNLFAKRENVGNVTVSVRKDLQQLAKDQLGDRQGAITVIDPKTGAILAMWSNPSYDPNLLVSAGTNAEIKAANDVKALYDSNPSRPLRSKVYREFYNPGSSFKPVTASAGLSTGKANLTKEYPQLPGLTFQDAPGYVLANYSSPATCGGNIFTILTVSCNSSFAQMGLDVGIKDLSNQATAFGWNQDVPIDLPDAVQSTIPTSLNDVGLAGTGQTAVGQQKNVATPLQIAMAAAAIANDGRLMTPHVMDRILNQDATVVDTYKAKEWLTPLTPDVARTMRDIMRGPVYDPKGSAYGRIRLPAGMVAGGKTGTAQTGGKGDPVHTWFMGFAGPDGQLPTVAVSVVVLRQNNNGEATGGQVAAPIANEMLNAALGVVGQAADPTGVIVTTTSSVPPAGPFGPGVGGPSTATVPTTIRRQG